MVRANTAEDFWSHIDQSGGPDSCWPWTAATREGRYGTFKMGGEQDRAHRWAWRLTHGPIPDELNVLHNCDVTLCCNPYRCLRLGTHADNMRDREERGRNRPRTRASGSTKLTTGQAGAIRERWTGGRSTGELAREFGISPTMVWKIGTGRA